MSLLKDYEDAIIDQLKSKTIGFAVEPFPNDPKTYDLLNPKGAFLVRYNGSRYTDPLPEGLVRQERILDYQIICVARNLRGRDSIYDMVQLALEALTGFQITSEESLRPTRDEFVDEVDGLWQHGLSFGFRMVHQEV